MLIGLALLSGPAIVFAAFGTSGFDSLFESAAEPADTIAIDEGRIAFATECATCHGRMAEGTLRAPALVGPRPDREALARIIRRGIAPRGRASHGMPAYPQMPDRTVDAIAAFLQAAESREAGR